MAICEFPDIDRHKRHHKKLTKQVEEYIKEYGIGRLTATELLNFLMSWLTKHILGEDLAIAAYCIGKDKEIEQAFKNSGYEYQPNENS